MLADFAPGETRLVTFRNPFSDPWDGETANVPAYVRCVEARNFTVFAINCAHLGCPVRWFSESQLFMCPCHGGVYYADGSRASGPPERGLFTYEVKIENGKLMIKAGQMPTLQNRAGGGAIVPAQPNRKHPHLSRGLKHVRIRRPVVQTPLRLARAARTNRRAGERRRAASGAEEHCELVVRLRVSASLTLLILQVFTGILLGLVYTPSAAHAWQSLQVLNHQLPLGWFLRAMHGWGSNFMVAVVLIHMAQVFLFGAYKFPRELTWIVGVFMLLMTLGMAFTGQVLRWDQDAYWGLGIGASIMGRVPLIGGELVHIMLGGPIISGATLTRFFALHVFVIPGTLLGLTALHVWMVLKLGINEWPMPGRVVRRETYVEEYNELSHKHGIPFVPGAVWKDLFFSAAIILAVAVCAAVFGPFGPKGVPDPTIINTVPKPDFFFLWIYSVLSFLPPEMETPFILIAPVVAVAVLVGLPLVAGVGEKSWWRRPVAVFAADVSG